MLKTEKIQRETESKRWKLYKAKESKRGKEKHLVNSEKVRKADRTTAKIKIKNSC